MGGLVLFLERLDLPNYIGRRHTPVLVKVALPVIAERTPPPIASPGCQIGKNADRNEIAVQGQPVEIGKRERRRFLGVDLFVDMDPTFIAIDEIGNLVKCSLSAERLKEPEQGMLALVQDRRVKDRGEEPLMAWELLLEPRNHVPADRDVDLREGLLDHLAEGQPRQELHLRADRDAHHVGSFVADRREHQLPADVTVHIHLLVIQTGEHFSGHAGTIAEVAFHRIKHNRGRIVRG